MVKKANEKSEFSLVFSLSIFLIFLSGGSARVPHNQNYVVKNEKGDKAMRHKITVTIIALLCAAILFGAILFVYILFNQDLIQESLHMPQGESDTSLDHIYFTVDAPVVLYEKFQDIGGAL